MTVPIMDTAARPIRRTMVSFREEKNPQMESAKPLSSVFKNALPVRTGLQPELHADRQSAAGHEEKRITRVNPLPLSDRLDECC
jgi:hypothetical protein